MRTKSRQKGASALELALVLPLLMVILFGIIEFGLILYDKAVITNASREAARKGIVFRVPGTTTSTAVTEEIVKTADKYCSTHLVSLGGASSPSITVTGNCFTAGSALTVSVSYPYAFLVLPKFAKGLADDLSLSGVTVMNCENQ